MIDYKTYPPNEKQWKRGDLVIHAADAKRADMLMRVTGRDRSGLIRTRYVRSDMWSGVYRNEARWLLDPADFGIKTDGEVTA